jgi:hypothetical protein
VNYTPDATEFRRSCPFLITFDSNGAEGTNSDTCGKLNAEQGGVTSCEADGMNSDAESEFIKGDRDCSNLFPEQLRPCM